MLLSCGDALIDFMPARGPDGREAYVPAVGGSCLNVAVAMARLGAPAGLVGGVSTDLFGRMIADHARASGVDLAHAARSGHQTTLAFVRFVDGEPHYGFYDAATAAQAWRHRPGAIPFDRVACLHVGSTTLIGPVADETLALVDEARAAGVPISFDPNCRPSLVANIDGYRRRMAEFFRRADIVKLSDVDFNYLYGHDDHAAERIADAARLVVVTRGAEGISAWHREAGAVAVPAPRVSVADTIGAGDSFQGAMLAALHEAGGLRGPVTADGLRAILAFAAGCAAVTVGRPGADPPWRHEVAVTSRPAVT